MAGPDDNILGGQDAVIRVGVEADMSEILQQATKFNELIKDANDSFNVMQTVITSTTTRMASLNSATLRLVASARQLRSEYQLIAESSQRIGYLGSPGGLEDVAGVAGIGGGSLAGLTSMVGGPMSTTPSGLVVPGGIGGEVKPIEIGEQFPGLPAAGQASVQAGLSTVGNIINKGVAARIGASSSNLARTLTNLVKNGAGASTLVSAALGNFLPGMSAAASAAGPYILPILGAAVAGYKALDYMTKGATKYTGLTGGTGVFTSEAEGNMYGLNRGSFVGLQAQKWASGLLNMAVGPGGYGEIQEGLLTAGYKPYGDAQADRMGMQGMKYDRTRGTLAALYAKGFQDVGANITGMQLSIESARTSTGAFTAAMDQLRLTAQRTNASMKGLQTAFTTVMKALSSGMGGTGNWTTLFASAAIDAYSNSRNSILRSGGAVTDLSQFGAQIQLINTPAFKEMGINLQNRFMAYSNGPGMAETLALGTDQAVDRLLNLIGIGNMRGRSAAEVEAILRNNSIGVDMLRQSPMMQSLVGPEVTGNINAFIEWLTVNATDDPTIASVNKRKQESGANFIKNFIDAPSYFNQTLGDRQSLSRDRINDFLRMNPGSSDRDNYPVLNSYYNYISRTGKSVGWLTSVLRSDEAKQTYVQFRDSVMPLGKFMEQYGFNNPESRKLIESGELKVATSTNDKQPDLSQFAAAYNIQASEKTVQTMSQAELQTTFTNSLSTWATHNNTLGNDKLKVSVDGAFGIG